VPRLKVTVLQLIGSYRCPDWKGGGGEPQEGAVTD